MIRIRLTILLIIVCLASLFERGTQFYDQRDEVANLWVAYSFAQEEEEEAVATEEGAATGETADEQPKTLQTTFSETELEILQRLSERRDTLERWEEEIKMRENILNLSQVRIQDKIDELRTLKNEVEKKLAEYNAQQDQKMLHLIKIYENMKPKDAARIFSDMDMNILVPLAEKMKDKSIAPIIASMAPEVAKRLTEELATRGRLFTP